MGAQIANGWMRSLSLAFLIVGSAFSGASDSNREQSVFSMQQEEDVSPILAPVDIPEKVLQLLRGDRRVLLCTKGPEKLTADKIPASWFVGSEIHLDGTKEVDLVVQPRFLHGPSPNRCLSGANIGPFWVFRRMPDGYSLVLSESALYLKVLGTRSNGYRDIELFSATAVTGYTVTYKFNGQKYEIYASKSQPLGSD